MLDGLQGLDIGPLFQRMGQAPFARGQVDQVSLGIEGQVRPIAFLKFVVPFPVVATDPPRHSEFHRFGNRVDAIFALEARHDDVKLEHPDGPQDKIAVDQGAKDLDGPFFGQLAQAFLQ